MKKILFTIITFLFVFNLNIIIFAHEHTEECYSYENTNHTHNGDEINGTGCYTKPIYHQHNEDCYGNCPAVEGAVTILSTNNVVKCDNSFCQSNNDENWVYTNNTKTIYNVTCNGCGNNGQSSYCSVCGTQTFSVSHKNVLTCSKNESYIESYELNCSFVSGTSNKILICDKKIISISPENNVQYKDFNDNLIITYQNGTTKITKATSSNYDVNKIYNGEIITLTYENYNFDIVFYSNLSNINNQYVDNLGENNNGTMNIAIVTPQVNQEVNVVVTTPIVQVEINKDIEVDSIENDLGIKDTIYMEIEQEVEKDGQIEELKTSTFSIFDIILITGLIFILSTIVILIVKKIRKGDKK